MDIITLRNRKKNDYQVLTDLSSALLLCDKARIIIDHASDGVKQAVNISVCQIENTGETLSEYLATQNKLNNSIIV